MVNKFWDTLDYLSHEKGIPQACSLVIIGVGIFYGVWLGIGAPGFLNTNILDFWLSFDNVLLAGMVTAGMFILSISLTVVIFASLLLVVSTVLGVANSIITHKLMRLSVILTLILLGMLLWRRWTALLGVALASSLSMWSGELNYTAFNHFATALNLSLIIAGMFIPLPEVVVKNMVIAKLLETVVGATTKQVRTLAELQTWSYVKIVERGGVPPSNIPLLSVMMGVLSGNSRDDSYRALTSGERNAVLNTHPMLAPYKRDLASDRSGALILGVSPKTHLTSSGNRLEPGLLSLEAEAGNESSKNSR